jgi:hypothetical protein
VEDETGIAIASILFSIDALSTIAADIEAGASSMKAHNEQIAHHVVRIARHVVIGASIDILAVAPAKPPTVH